MTRTTNARLAGFLLLFYIATAYLSAIVFDRATGGLGVVAKLASTAAHAPLMRVKVVLTLLGFVNAVALGVALYGITRDEDHELAVLALSCRVAEGVIIAMSVVVPLGLLWIATGIPGAAATDASATTTLAAFLLKTLGWSVSISATCFAMGSTLYAWLFLRARSIPTPLAWLGVRSAVLVVGLPTQLAGWISGPVTAFMWAPIFVFEVVLGFWLVIKGVAIPETRSAFQYQRAAS